MLSCRTRTVFLVLTVLVVTQPLELGAQAKKGRLRIIPASTIIAAESMRRVCLDRVTHPETLSVRMSIIREDRPRWWPKTTKAMLERVRPDEVRGGVRFPLYRVIRIDIGPTPIRGNLGAVAPAEEIGNAEGPELCLPFDALGFSGSLTKSLRFRQ